MILPILFLSSILNAGVTPTLWRAETPTGEIVRLDASSDTITLICFYSTYACGQCYSELNGALSEIQSSIERIRCVVVIKSNASMRRLLLHNAKVDFPNCKEFYFDIPDSDTSSKSSSSYPAGLWARLNIGYCPSAMILGFKHGKLAHDYFSFDELFGPTIAKDGEKAYASLSSHMISAIHHLRNKKAAH